MLLSDCGIIPYFGRKDIQFIDSLCLNNGDMAAIKTRQSLSLYAMEMQSVIKPAWVVSTYYPPVKRSNALDDELRRIGFFNGYTLVKRYQSHRIAFIKGMFIDQEADFAYLLYKKNEPCSSFRPLCLSREGGNPFLHWLPACCKDGSPPSRGRQLKGAY